MRQLYTNEHISLKLLVYFLVTEGPVKRKRGRPKGSTKKKPTIDSNGSAEHDSKEKTPTSQEVEQPCHLNKGSAAAVYDQFNMFSFDYYFSKLIDLAINIVLLLDILLVRLP